MARKPFTGIVTDAFGIRVHPISKEVGMHWGMDGVGAGNYAPADGQLIAYFWSGGYGYLAIFLDKYGWIHWFGHNASASPFVEIGQWVPEGTLITPMGTTGNSDGVHCHWETYRPTGERVNPQVYLDETAAVAPSGAGTTEEETMFTPEQIAQLTTAILNPLIARVEAAESRMLRVTRARLYKCTTHENCWLTVDNVSGKVGYPKSLSQIESLQKRQYIGDDIDRAKAGPHDWLETQINLAQGDDKGLFEPSEHFSEHVAA